MPFSNKSIYRLLCDEKSIPLFMQAWWMDTVCGTDNWDVLLSEQNGRIVGALPFLLVKKAWFRIIIQPQLTQFNGIWINYTYGMHEDERCIFEKQVETDLINQLETKELHYFNQNFHYNITHCNPYLEKGFIQTTRYTYIIDDISNTEKVYAGFTYAKQKHIKKSKGELLIDEGISAAIFYNFHANTLKQKGEKIVYSKELFLKIYKESVARNQGKIIGIADKQGNIHSALFIVWDAQRAYYLISAIDNNYKSSGASTLMVWEAIQFLSDKTKVFDFEGSMIENVAKSFKEFGSVPMAYTNISKQYSPLFMFLMRLLK